MPMAGWSNVCRREATPTPKRGRLRLQVLLLGFKALLPGGSRGALLSRRSKEELSAVAKNGALPATKVRGGKLLCLLH
jgi:hypothetical protein